MTNIIEINGCKHYCVNENGSKKPYFYDTSFMVEVDFDINHPFGNVYRPKSVLDTPIRFVRQINNTAFIFNKNEWNVITNPFMFKNKTCLFKKIIKLIFNGDKNTK
jgi:hypothetical protein